MLPESIYDVGQISEARALRAGLLKDHIHRRQ
jgi:hypothetical protein